MANLFDNISIGNLHLKNRVIMAPMNMGGLVNTDGSMPERSINYFVERAKGGVGMITTGAVRVTREFERDQKTIPLWMLFADHMIHASWIGELSERCHDYGCKVCIQLTAGGGRIAGRYAQEHGLAISASVNKCYYPPYKETREITKDEINKIVAAFENSARIIKNAGADAIQLHGHEGYLIDQFSTELWNKRTDEYGGSLENRLRFAKEIIEAIKRGAGNDFPIIYRYGLTHFIEGGRSIDEGLKMAKILESYGVAALDIDAGCYENWFFPHPPTTIPCGTFADLAHKVKEVVSIPVISSARIGYPDVAENIISSNKADCVSIGRPLIADSEWCLKAKQGNSEQIRPCLACHEGCLKRDVLYKNMSCAVNPAAGNEEYLKIPKSDKPQSISVIGGGVAGMVAAIVATERGHKVTLYEKSNQLGGNFKLDYIPDFKSDYQKYILYLTRKINKLGIDVRLNTQINLTELDSLKSDWTIVAVGATFKTIKLNGLEKNNLVDPFDLYKTQDYSSTNVLIIGGGLVGVEAAINVVKQGGNATIVEAGRELARTSYRANRDHLLTLLEQYDIPCYTDATISSIDCNKVSLDQKTNPIYFNCIAICCGMEPPHIECNNERTIVIGDADKPDNVLNAVWTAYRKTRLI